MKLQALQEACDSAERDYANRVRAQAACLSGFEAYDRQVAILGTGEISEPATHIDCGTGTGKLLEKIVHRWTESGVTNFTLIGVEINKYLAAEAAENLRATTNARVMTHIGNGWEPHLQGYQRVFRPDPNQLQEIDYREGGNILIIQDDLRSRAVLSAVLKQCSSPIVGSLSYTVPGRSMDMVFERMSVAGGNFPAIPEAIVKDTHTGISDLWDRAGENAKFLLGFDQGRSKKKEKHHPITSEIARRIVNENHLQRLLHSGAIQDVQIIPGVDMWKVEEAAQMLGTTNETPKGAPTAENTDRFLLSVVLEKAQK